MNSVHIVPVTPSEIPALALLSRQIFEDSFAKDNQPEDMQLYMENAFSPNILEAELNNPNSFFYFAKMEENLVGYLKLNTAEAQTEFQDPHGLEIERIYVKHEYHGSVVAKQLMEFSIAKAQ